MTGAGKPKVKEDAESGHRWVSQEERRAGRWRTRLTQGSRLETDDREWAKPAESSKTQVGTAPALGKCTQQEATGPAVCLLAPSSGGIPFAQGPS